MSNFSPLRNTTTDKPGRKIPLAELLCLSNQITASAITSALIAVIESKQVLAEFLVYHGLMSARDIKNTLLAQSMIVCGSLSESDAVDALRVAFQHKLWLADVLAMRDAKLEALIINFETQLESMLAA